MIYELREMESEVEKVEVEDLSEKGWTKWFKKKGIQLISPLNK